MTLGGVNRLDGGLAYLSREGETWFAALPLEHDGQCAELMRDDMRGGLDRPA